MRFSNRMIPAKTIMATVLLAITLAACGGTASSTMPADVAKAFYATAFAEKPNIEPYVCASNRAFADSMMVAMTTMKTTMNVSMFDTSDLKFVSGSQADNKVTVTVSGKVKGTVAGKPIEIEYPPTPITLRNENGWKICA